jgi:hypothetical protein
MKKHASKAGVSPKQYDLILNPKFKIVEESLATRLQVIHDHEHKAIVILWTKPHINEDMWNNYDLFFTKDVLPEMKLMRQHRRAFKKAWSNLLREIKSERTAARNRQDKEKGKEGRCICKRSTKKISGSSGMES